MAVGTIKLTTIGLAAGPFDLYSNADSFTTPFAVGITRAQLLAGYQSNNFPDLATIIRVKSTLYCINYLDITVTLGC